MAENTIEDILRDIKKELRANMNGVASQYMREHGVNDYRVNFGIELPRIQQIAEEFQPNHQLAQQLWNESVRECKILATMLMPTERFFPEIADIWADEIPNSEIASLLVINLLQKLPYAPDLAFQWIASDNDMRQLCGFLLVQRLLMQGATFNERAMEELRDQAQATLPTSNLQLKKAAAGVLNRLEE